MTKVQASHLTGQTQIWANPQLLLQTERANTQDEKILYVCSFSVSDIFAIAKVMLFALLIMMLLAKARNDVMFARYAVRRNIIHAVNITAAGNIICPQGQTSFSVNAPLRASRYFPSRFFSKL